MEITYYVHGSTLDNESMIASGWDQVSLSPRGVEKTKKAAPYVDTRLFDAVFASDLIRAIETAGILFADRKTEIKTDPPASRM